MTRLLLLVISLCVLPPSASGQMNYQPTPPPVTAAVDRDWYRSGDPIPFAGDLYYPTGPTVYFNGYSMVPTGNYDGITLYADTTIEPYSVIFVPVSDQILRPYRRVQAGERVGTTGLQPTERSRMRRRTPRPEDTEVPESPRAAPFETRLESARKPEGNLGIWVRFEGYRWEQAGQAVVFDPAKLAGAGDYHGFTVYADPKAPYVIYIPSRGNLVAPFRRTPG